MHALSTYFTIDYKQNIDKPIDIQQLLAALNSELMWRNVEVRVNSIEEVDENLFEAHRNVDFRRYVYRIAVKKHCENSKSDDVAFPIEELERSYFIE